MSTKYQYYVTGYDSSLGLQGAIWGAQTFTPNTAHKITSVKLYLKRGIAAYPTTFYVGIKATDGNGHPTDADLCSGSIASSTLGISFAWHEITLGAGADLSANTKYAIVCHATAAMMIDYWGADGSSPTYAGGCFEYSNNAGVSWTSYTGYDFLFEEWGEAVTIHELVLTDGIAIGEALVKTPMKVFSDGIQFSDVLIKNPIKIFVDGIAFTDVFEGYKLLAKVLIDGIAIGEALVKSTSKVVSDGIAFTDTLLKHVEKVLADGIKIGEVLRKDMTKVLVDGITFTDIVTRYFEKVFTDGIKIGECLTHWRWLTAIRNLPRPRCPKPSVREQDKIDDGNV